MKKIVRKMLSLFLAVILCMGLCTDLAVRAEESSMMTEEQSESAEADKTDDALTEAGQPDISEAEKEQGESETDKVEVSDQEADESDSASEESDMQEEQGQPDAFEYSEGEPQADPEETEELEQSEARKQMESAGAAQGLKPPRIVTGCSWMNSGQEVTYDCVYFGSYPQSEVLKSSDPVLYARLQELSENGGFDSNNEVEIDGNLYRRVDKYDASYRDEDATVEGLKGDDTTNPPTLPTAYHYPWSDYDDDDGYDWDGDGSKDHYFKYEPIKWRVLSVDGDNVFLLSDVALDCQSYSEPKTRAVINWDSELRNWLNGWESYDKESGERSFINDAFDEKQQKAIVEQQSAIEGQKEKIFLLSADEVSGSGAETKKYGFVRQPENDPNAKNEYYKIDEARQCKSSNYAFAMGTRIDPYKYDYPKCNNCYWWLCSSGKKDSILYPGESEPKEGTIRETVSSVGIVSGDDGGDWEDEGYYGIRPALWVNLSEGAPEQWEKAGTVCSNVEREDSGDEPQKPSTGDSGNQKPNTGSGTKKPVKVTKITLSGASHKIAAGKRIKLTAKVYPANASNKSLKWKSSNTKVATVSSKGVVTLKKKSGGKSVTITAQAKDGSGKKRTWRITSMKGVVKKITITGKATRKVKAGKSLSLKAKVTATNSKKAYKKLKWVSSNKKYATVSSTGKVKTKKAAKGKNVKITAAALDGSGKKKTVTIKIR